MVHICNMFAQCAGIKLGTQGLPNGQYESLWLYTTNRCGSRCTAKKRAMQVKLKHEQCRLNNINALVQHMGQDCKAHLQLLKSPQTLNGCDTVTVQVQATQLWAQVQALY